MLLPGVCKVSHLWVIFITHLDKAFAYMVSDIRSLPCTKNSLDKVTAAVPCNHSLCDSLTPHRSLTINWFRETSVPCRIKLCKLISLSEPAGEYKAANLYSLSQGCKS